MNLWLLTSEFPPLHGGGISTYCYETAKMFSSNGHLVTVFVNDHSVSNYSITQLEENIRIIRFTPTRLKKGEFLGYEARLSLEFSSIVEEFLIKETAPDVIEAQDYLGIGYYTFLKKKLLYPSFHSIKMLVTLHAPSFLYLEYNQVPHYRFPDFWIGEMEKGSIKLADKVISPSNYLLDEINERFDIFSTNAKRIFNPFSSENSVDLSHWNNYSIAFLGKLTPQKGCLELFEAFKKIWDSGGKSVLTIIGGGNHYFHPFKEDMIDFLKRNYQSYLSKGLVKFEGNLSPDKLNQKLKEIDIILVPSIVENLPYAVIEVMSKGKIVLASTSGGQREIIEHNKSGFLFDHSKANDFQDKLISILSIKPNELLNIRQNAIERIQELFSPKQILDQKLSELSSPLSNSNQFPFTREQLVEKEKNSDVNNPLLSIVIPYYNMGEFIEDTLKSLVKCDYSPIEILVINDGSSAEHQSIIEKLQATYEFKLFHKPNEGLSETRNYGVQKASGGYLAFLDSDDTVEPSYFSKSISILKTYTNVHFVGCWAQYFGESKDIWPTFNPEPPYLLYHNMINSSALIYKKDSFLASGKNDAEMIYGMEDYDSVISLVKMGYRGVSIPETLWNYRIRKNSMQQAFTPQKQLFLFRKIANKHQDFISLYSNEIYHLFSQNGPGYKIDNPTWAVSNKINIPLLNTTFGRLIKKNPILRKIGKKIYQKFTN